MNTPLTAHLCAVAIVAATNAYGDDPVGAFTAKAGRTRRGLAPAAAALSAQTGHLPSQVCRVIGLRVGTYKATPSENALGYRVALKSAVRRLAEAQAGAPAPQKVSNAIATWPIAQPQTIARINPSPPIVVAPSVPARIDHTSAISEAMRRRAARPIVSVAGVDKDKLLLPVTKAGGCAWPMGDPRAVDYRACNAEVVTGRMYCPTHARAAGQKPVPRPIQTVGRVARPYGEREAG